MDLDVEDSKFDVRTKLEANFRNRMNTNIEGFSIMEKETEFPATTKAERAASMPGPRTVSALLEKVDFPNNYVHEPDVPGESDANYFAVSFNYDYGPPLEQIDQPEFTDRTAGANATRLRDAVPADPNRSHIIVFEKQVKKADLSDFYGWSGDFWLISDRLRRLIEDLDPGSIECVEAVGHNLTPNQPYWACLSKRNLEAVDTTKSGVRVTHENLAADGEKPIISQRIIINRGAIFDSEVTKGAHHFWDIDLRRWFWSRELIARAHHAGIRGPRLTRSGQPMGGDVTYIELDKIYSEYGQH